MITTGSNQTEDALFTTSAAAKRAFFSPDAEPAGLQFDWRRRLLPPVRHRWRSSQPEIVRVLCGRKLHRLRLVAAGGPTVLLDHPQLDRKAELAMVALGAPMPVCLLVQDAIAGRRSARRILWRRRAFAIASVASVRRSCRRRGPTPAL